MDIEFVVLDGDGREARRGTCNHVVLDAQTGPDETVVLGTPTHWLDDETGVEHERPTLELIDIGAAQALDLTVVAGPTRIRDELGTVYEAPGGEPCELPPGTYKVCPPFPYQLQTVEVA